MRFAAYAGASVVLATSVIIRALHERANFYSACVYLAQSNACIMILSHFILLGIGVVMLGLQRVLYGPLRPIEVEQLYEKAWFAVTETCLAMTIFREEIGAWFMVMFVSLLIGKVWAWIGEGRVEVLQQQPPTEPRLFHARLSTSLILSFLLDFLLLKYTVATVRRQARPNMMVMFAFEFAVLAVTSLSTCARYGISLREAGIIQQQTNAQLRERREQIQRDRDAARREALESNQDPLEEPTLDELLDESDIDVPGWEEKGRYIFYLDIVTVLYLTFFCTLCMFYGMPIHIIRDVALTIRSFYKRVTDFVKYRQATRDMNSRYPDATAEEIGDENVCIICREIMRLWQPADVRAGDEGTPPAGHVDERLRPKKLPCGHILHFACLRSWLERQQNCPTCRQPVLNATSIPHIPAGVAGQARAQAQHNIGAGALPGPANQQRAIAGQNRIRFFNLGPIRLGFGAGQDFRGRGPQVREPAILEARRAPTRHDTLAQQFGLGLRPGHQQRANNDVDNAPFSLTGVQTQLQNIEQQLLREVHNLRLQADQLNIIRALQAELTRLRAAQLLPDTSNVNNTSQSPSAMYVPNVSTPTTTQPFNFDTQRERPMNVREALPGVNVPEGWTLIPLRRLPTGPGLHHVPPVNVSHSGISMPRETALAPQTSARDLTTSDEVNQQNTRDQPSLTPSLSGNVPGGSPGVTSHTAQAQTTKYEPGGSPSPLEDANTLLEDRIDKSSLEHNNHMSTRSLELGASGGANTQMSRSASDWPEHRPRLSEWRERSHASGPRHSEMSVDSGAEHREAKGKGRATTVEDAGESE